VLESVDRAVGLPAVFDVANWLVPALAILWLAGAVVLLTRLARQWHGARQLRLGATAAAAPELESALERLAARMAIRRGIALRTSDRIAVPMVLGWRRPMVLLPPDVCRTLSTAQIEAVLAHELAHIRARDYLVNLLQVVVDALLFFHPAARWISHQVRREREFRCDDAAIADGRDRVVYARALAALEESRCDPMAVAASASAGPLVDRIARLLGRSVPPAGVTRRVAAAAIVMVLALAAAASLVVLPPGFGKGIRPRTRRPPPAQQTVAPDDGLRMKAPGTFERGPAR
jgi:beta-lactamase regulating signal transducer with metallopeptidase domain